MLRVDRSCTNLLHVGAPFRKAHAAATGRAGHKVGARRARLAESAQSRLFWQWVLSIPLTFARTIVGFVIGYAGLALVALGVFRDPTQSSTPQLLALAGLSILLVAKLFERIARSQRDTAVLADLELGTLCVAAAFVLIELTGGPSGFLYPLIYALVAFLVAFHGVRSGAYFLVLILGTETLINILQPATRDYRLLLSHASFILLFGFLYAVFLRSEVAQRRNNMLREIDAHMQKVSDEARQFRLTSGLSLDSRELSPEELARRRRVGSIQAIHESFYNVLAVAERALSPYTVALLWLDADDKKIVIKELRSQSDHVTNKALVAAEGFIGAVTKRREPLILTQLKAGHSGLVYYTQPQPVTDFAGVPVLEDGHLRGVLIADRDGNRPFTPGDIDIMNTIAEELVRAVRVERIFSDMDREKYEKERFYQASRDFNEARTVDEVAKVAIRASRAVTRAEFAAVAVSTEEGGKMRIAAIDWQDNAKADELVGQVFLAEEGLVGASIKARHALPHGTARAASQPVFAKTIEADLAGAKVLPLLWQDRGIGALVLGSSHENFLSNDAYEMMRVISDHATIAIANAQMYERMERMATTDGLTSLTNHRYFQELFDAMLARCERYGRKMSLILTDIDHFKSINDTYGHPVGDMVLKKVAKLLTGAARRTDVVARYGGEEFAVLMEETGTDGALQTAERIRKAVENEMMRSENGSFKCTISLGIATFPQDANVKAKLAECADQALYQAKRSGRNRSVVFRSAGRQTTSEA